MRSNPDLSDTQRAKLEKAIKRAYDANTKYMRAQEAVLNALSERGITEDDLQKEYFKKNDEKVAEIAEEVGFDANNTVEIAEAYSDNAEIMEAYNNEEIDSFYGKDGEIVVKKEGDEISTGTEIVALNTVETIKTSSTEVYNDILSVADKLMSVNEEFSKAVDIYAKEYMRQGIAEDEALKRAKQTAMANLMARYLKDKPGVFTRIALERKIADVLRKVTTSIVTKELKVF